MRIVYCLSLIVILCCGFVCRQTPSALQTNPRAAVAGVERFGVQFSGTYSLAEMAPYQLMFIDPDQASENDADSISARGGLSVAYLNVGEAEAYRWFYADIRREWMLAPNPNWPDHFYIDVNAQGWHTLLIRKVLPAIFKKGFNGIFLDMVDVASPQLYPLLQPGMISLIGEIRKTYPDKIIIMNNGTFLAKAVTEFIDGIVVESVFFTYDFASKTYAPVNEESTIYRCTELEGIMKSAGTKIFAIDYALPGDTLAARSAIRQSAHHGFASFVSTIELNSLPKQIR